MVKGLEQRQTCIEKLFIGNIWIRLKGLQRLLNRRWSLCTGLVGCGMDVFAKVGQSIGAKGQTFATPVAIISSRTPTSGSTVSLVLSLGGQALGKAPPGRPSSLGYSSRCIGLC